MLSQAFSFLPRLKLTHTLFKVMKKDYNEYKDKKNTEKEIHKDLNRLIKETLVNTLTCS